ESIAHRLPEERIAQQVKVVFEADEAEVVPVGDGVEVEVGEAQEQRGGDGQEEEQEDDGEPGAHEQPGGADLARRFYFTGHSRASPPAPCGASPGCGPPAGRD